METGLEEMSIWSLVAGASVLVQTVMLILVLASVISWYLIVLRAKNLARTEKENAIFIRRFRQVDDLVHLYDEVTNKQASVTHLQGIFSEGYREFSSLKRLPNIEASQVTEGAERAMLVAIGKEEAQLEKGLSFLATVGSVSPYIGLFGTVWGIMNAFIGLSQVQQATLSTVAPGIAEALIATAIGLFAAIPAVIAYNRFSARGATITASYYTFGNELQMRLHRLLHTPLKPVSLVAGGH
jgi:biopolymer transport protein TolQ